MTGSHKTAPVLARRLVPGLALVLALAPGLAARAEDGDRAAPPHDARLEMAFGSTIVSTYPDGRQAELWLKRDGTYQAEGRRHDRTSGTWQLKSDRGGLKLCLKQRRPFPAPFSYCPNVPEGGLDRPWTSKAFTGERISVRLVPGVFDPATGGQQEGSRKAQAVEDGDNG
jgi:hypothetical protein